MDKKNVVTAKIFGSDYTISGEETKEYIMKVCETVDRRMRFAAQNSSLNPMRASILCAVNLCDEMFKNADEADSLRVGLENLKTELRAAEKQIKVLSEENSYLKDEIRNLKRTNTEKMPNERRHS